MFELHHLTAQEQWDWLQRGDVSPTELADHYLLRIAAHEQLGAFSRLNWDAALVRAAHVEDSVPRSRPLWGLPLAEKELSRRRGFPASGGSRLRAGELAGNSDDLVLALDTAGSVSLGATTAPEFGLTGYTEPAGRMAARNPWELSLGAGGSSGGAAVAVAAGLLPFAPASDGGGSIRIPAASTGLVGLKPSRGRVPSSAVAGLAGLATAGPIARTVADAAMLLDAMISPDGLPPSYRAALRAPGDGPFLSAAVRGEGRFQVGVLQQSPWDDALEITVDPEGLAAVELTIAALDAMGHGIDRATLPTSDYARFFPTLWQASAAGVPAAGPELDQLEPFTRWLIEGGRALTASAILEAIAAAGEFERSVISRFSEFDAVLTPALAELPRPLGWFSANPAENFSQQVRYAPFSSFVNVAGLPAITLPVHWSAGGLPVGVQMIGRPGGEATLLALGAQLERRIGWRRRHPPQW